MFTNAQQLERIEAAQTTTPFCEECGLPTTIVDRDGALWLACMSLTRPRSRLQSVLRLDFASIHTQRPVTELAAA